MSLKRLSKRTTMIAAGCALALPIAAGSAYATLGADLPAVPQTPDLGVPMGGVGDFGGSYGLGGAEAWLTDEMGSAAGAVSPDGALGEFSSPLGSGSGAAGSGGLTGEVCAPTGQCFSLPGGSAPDGADATGSASAGEYAGGFSGSLSPEGALGEFDGPLGSGSFSGTLDSLSGEFCPASGAECVGGLIPPVG